MATSPPGLNHILEQDSLDQLRARLGQEQFEQARAESMALSSDNSDPICTSGLMIAEDPPTAQNGGSACVLLDSACYAAPRYRPAAP